MSLSGFAKIDGRVVAVVDEDCEHRPCFSLGFDKGSFVQGRGYTSYHRDGARPVCWTRHLSGCPHVGVHLTCGGCHDQPLLVTGGDPRPVMPSEPCHNCGKHDWYWLADVLPEPSPCCSNPDVPNNPTAYRQKCRSCGQTLRGRRLEIARAGAA